MIYIRTQCNSMILIQPSILTHRTFVGVYGFDFNCSSEAETPAYVFDGTVLHRNENMWSIVQIPDALSKHPLVLRQLILGEIDGRSRASSFQETKKFMKKFMILHDLLAYSGLVTDSIAAGPRLVQ